MAANDALKVVIVIPTHNRKSFLEKCLDSIIEQTYTNYKVIVVNDGSTDGTNDILDNSFPEIRVIHGDGNWWWTRSVNEGIRVAFQYEPNYILLLNDDVILHNNYLSNMIRAANDNPLCLIGSASKDVITKEYNYIGVNADWKRVRRKVLIDLYDRNRMPEYIKVNMLPGRGLFIPIEVFQMIGFFDEKNFPQANADADFSMRANKKGYGLIVSTRAYLFSYTEDGPDKYYESKYNIENFFKRLYEKRSKQNLYYLLKFNFRHCPRKWFFSYTTINFIAVIFGYLKRWMKSVYIKRIYISR